MSTAMMDAKAGAQMDRRGFLGGSDAAAVLGLSRWRSPLDVWSEKTGAIAPKDRSKELPVRLGHRLEDVVAELFSEETGKSVRRVSEAQVHPKYPFIRAQIDRRVVGEDAVLEIKTASGFKAAEWEDEDVPSEYLLQCLHQLAVTGRERCYIACLIGGNQDFVYKIVERDEAMIEELVRKEVEFWDFVQSKRMPRVSAIDAPTLLGLFPNHKEGEVVELPPAAEDAIRRYKEIGTEKTGLLSELLKEKDLLGNQLRAMLGEAEVGTVGSFKVSWKSQSTGVRLDADRIKKEAPDLYEKFGKAGSTRVLRVGEIKQGGK